MISRDLAAALKEPEAVRELDLSGTNAELPSTLAKLKNLEVLRLEDNGLTELPEAIGKLKKLRELRVARNALTSEKIHRSIWFLPALEVLDLRANRLTWIDNLGNYQKQPFAVYLAENPLDVAAYTNFGRPVHPLWTHTLHMLPLLKRKGFLRAVSIDLDRIAFPLPEPQMHYEPPFKQLELLELHGRTPTADERAQLAAAFPKAKLVEI